MPFQPFNYAGLKPQGYSGLVSGVDSFKQSLQKARDQQLQKQVAQSQAAHAKVMESQAAQRMAMQQQQFDANIPMNEAHLDLYKAQAEKARAPATPASGALAKAMQDRNAIYNQYPEGSDERKIADSYIDKISHGSQGITVIDPKTGNPMVQIGGRGSSSRSGGGLYQSGDETVSMPTPATTTGLQNVLTSSPAVTRGLNQAKELGKYLGPKKRFLTKAEGLANTYLGTSFDDPSRKHFLESTLDINAEKMVKAANLRGTVEAIRLMQKALHPVSGESEEGFKKRLTDTLVQIKENQSEAGEFVSGGFRMKRDSSKPSGRLKFNAETGGLDDA